jgi:hypothetical protein
MKAKLFLLCAAALTFGGCATYTGGTGDSGMIEGSDASYTDVEPRMAVPVYRLGSPNGNDMGGNRPDIIFYR